MPRFITLSKPKKIVLKKKVPNWNFPNSIERNYITDLYQLVNKWKRDMKELIFPQIESFLSEASGQLKTDSMRTDDWMNRLSSLIEAFKVKIGIDETKAISELMFTAGEINSFNAKQWFKITGSVLGIPLVQAEPWLEPIIKAFAKENIDLITDLQMNTYQQVSTTINRAIKQNLRVGTIKNQLLQGTDLEKGVFRKIETRAALIARDQVGKLNGQLTNYRQVESGIKTYYWRDVNDIRVRTNHRAMNGLLCRWADSTSYSEDGGKTWVSRGIVAGVMMHPGQDYQCRCLAEPNFVGLSLENV